MSEELAELAQAAGLASEWLDFEGVPRRVPEPTLRAVLERLELPCASAAQCRDSLAGLQRERDGVPALLVARVGEPFAVPPALGAGSQDRYRLELEQGEVVTGQLDDALQLVPPTAPGYHQLELGGHRLTLAIAPARCFALTDLAGERRLWGLGAQLYSLRRAGDGGIGDFTALALLARAAARAGADALALSPAHALFSAEPRRHGPYSPSSRLFLNPLYADPAIVFGEAGVREALAVTALESAFTAHEQALLIDWPAAARAKLALLRALYRSLPQLPQQAEFKQFCATGGSALRAHAAFETLHAHFLARDAGAHNWQDWPAALHDPESSAVAEFLREHTEEFGFHQFLQWLADAGLAAAQGAARDTGMAVGLLGDLAIGTDGGGSHAWSRQRDMLRGLGIGAPPDALNAQGQDWGLTTFSPSALRRSGFRPFIELLRAALRHVGGVRIDHVLGLQRLWLVPHGAGATAGVYLSYPRDTLYALLALESWRAQAIVIGEDLGTVPPGFREQLQAAGLLGTRTLWFERDHGLFVDPSRWPREVAAMTSSHDVATVAGWWRGRDLDWRARLAMFTERGNEAEQRARRGRERQALWDAFLHAGLAAGPLPDDGAGVPAAAAAFVARTPARLALIAVEDMLGIEEQVNIPGTTDSHPNWRRRLPVAAHELLAQAPAKESVSAVQRERPRADKGVAG